MNTDKSKDRSVEWNSSAATAQILLILVNSTPIESQSEEQKQRVAADERR